MSIIHKITEFLFPSYCVVCGRRLLVGENAICLHCNMALPRTYQWNTPEENEMVKKFWGRMNIVKGCSYIYHIPHADTANIIYDIKYHNRPDVANTIGYMMAQEIGATGFFDDIDIIIPVPVSTQRQKKRGYNQCEEIGKGINRIYNIPVVTDVLMCHDSKLSQTRQNIMQRRDNVAGAFYLSPRTSILHGKHCLLLDDIITTGSTLIECADMLKGIPGISMSALSYGFVKGNG